MATIQRTGKYSRQFKGRWLARLATADLGRPKPLADEKN